jgi:hypothetical protein
VRDEVPSSILELLFASSYSPYEQNVSKIDSCLMSDVLDLALQVECPVLWEARMLCEGSGRGLDELLAPRRWAIFENGKTHKSPPAPELSSGHLNGYFWQLDPGARPRSSVQRVSLLLGKSRQQIRRYFGILKKRGKIPPDSFDGYRWCMSDEEVIALVKEQFATESRQRAMASPDPTEVRLAELGRNYRNMCRKRAHDDEVQNRPAQVHKHLRQRFRNTFKRQNPGVEMLPEAAEDWLNGDSLLKIALYVAQVERPSARLSRLPKLLGLSRTTFWRRYGRDQDRMRDARNFVNALIPKGEIVTEQPPPRAKCRYGADGKITT